MPRSVESDLGLQYLSTSLYMTAATKIKQATVKVVPALLDRAGPTLSMNTVKCLYNGFIALNRQIIVIQNSWYCF